MSRRSGKKRGGQRRLYADEYAALKREAESVRMESVHGYRPDLTLKRESRSAGRVGARARFGDGMLERDVQRLQVERQVEESRGRLARLAYRAHVDAKDSADLVFADTVNNNNREG